MQTVIIVIHLMIVAVLIGSVLLQKSEGGGLLDTLKKADERPQNAPAPSAPEAPRSQ